VSLRADYAARLLARPVLVLAVATVLALLALTRLFDFSTAQPRLELDTGMSALWPQDGPRRATHARVRATFGDDDSLLVVWLGDELFTAERLAAYRDMTRTIAAVPGVIAVESLAAALDLTISDDTTVITPFLDTLPPDDDAALALRRRALANPLVRGLLVAPDGRGLMLAVRFAAGQDSAALERAVADIERISARAAAGVENFVSGSLRIRLELGQILRQDLLTVMPLAMLATLAVAAIGFRNLRGTLLPLMANGMTTAMSLALFAVGGHALDFVTASLPPVIFVVGFAYAIHVVCAFDRCYRVGAARRVAVIEAVREVARPLALTALTTAIAFASLALSALASIRLFGLYAALGTLFAWLGAMTVVPAALVLLPGSPRMPRAIDRSAAIATWLAQQVQAHRLAILGLAVLLATAALACSTRITVDTAVLRNFPVGSAVVSDFERIADVFAGPVPLEVVIEADRNEAFLEPETLRVLAEFGAWLAAEPGVGAVLAFTDYVALLHKAIAPEQARDHALPSTARLARHALLLGGDREIGLFVDADYARTLVRVSTTVQSTAAVNAIATQIAARLQELPPGLRGEVTGTTYLTAHTVEAITRGQLRGLVLALGAIGLVIALVHRSPRIGLIALIPNALPILAYFGLLGLLPVTLNLTTSLVACAVFGIAIDDTVHFLARYTQDRDFPGAPNRALTATYVAVLRPVSLTTAALCAGFAALAAADLRAEAEFGLLAAATLSIAWLVDLTVTPALFRSLAPSHKTIDTTRPSSVS